MDDNITSENRAVSVPDESGSPSSRDNMNFDCCDDPVLFEMRDNYHTFTMGLYTILNCLKIAERAGHVPKLPDGWWIDIQIRYRLGSEF